MDWISFLDSNQIYYVTSGPNTARDQASIQCPFCGIDDPSQHMSISLSGKGFRCWRNPAHSGKNPAKLIQALLNCTWQQAQQYAGQERTLPSDFLAKIKSTFDREEIVEHRQKLKLPAEFKEFRSVPSARPYLAYLNARGFTEKDANEFGLYYASQGLYKGRIIFTITMHGKLVCWTGRTIYEAEQVRYKTLTHDKDKANERGETPAAAAVSDCLLFYDRVGKKTSGTIVLCEGPFDAFKLSVLGDRIHVSATCFFTSSISKGQMNLLHELLPRFDRRVLLLDQNTFSKATKLKSDLISLDVEMCKLPRRFKDPAELETVKDLKEVLDVSKH